MGGWVFDGISGDDANRTIDEGQAGQEAVAAVLRGYRTEDGPA
ncbi:hypothetical protein [Paractinoplanes toevensis]|uniref:Uncharacterized protein n=1 Tax=Paractinoplanes toevensis TaxID=571911 RepID=A0A920BQH5_9ACTN|nr:hypothetical protein [Actinoplanes toevensis]GIM96706.1 hypothetical protein Ato02nite_084990 [Actinoplanes toevensis]